MRRFVITESQRDFLIQEGFLDAIGKAAQAVGSAVANTASNVANSMNVSLPKELTTIEQIKKYLQTNPIIQKNEQNISGVETSTEQQKQLLQKQEQDALNKEKSSKDSKDVDVNALFNTK